MNIVINTPNTTDIQNSAVRMLCSNDIGVPPQPLCGIVNIENIDIFGLLFRELRKNMG